MKNFEFAAPILDSSDPAFDVPCVVSKERTVNKGNKLNDYEILGIALCLHQFAGDTTQAQRSVWYTDGLSSALR